MTLATFLKVNPPKFKGTTTPTEADTWFRAMERALQAQLGTRRLLQYDDDPIFWSAFQVEFYKKYFPNSVRTAKKLELLQLKQGAMSVLKYTRKREEGDPREGSAGGGGRTILADRRCRCVLLLAPPPPSRKLRFLLAVAVEIAKRDGSRVKGGRGLGAAAPSSPLFAFPVAVVQREASRGRCTSQPCLPPPCRRGGSRRVTERERERQGTGAEERKERPTPATAAYAARNPAAAAGVCITGKGFKLGFYSFGFREPLSSLHVYFSSPPPMLVVLNCCTVVVAVQVTGNMAVITGTTIGVTVISIQPFVLIWDRVPGLDC
ncbi:uncharacterized protein LOC110266883 [Arachis ipaensis]|uniref:uncharacterized protein LOC110266883 n=1 Tax=Arachis ipaensis TaxID=130454 RepID=UPI000A2AF464|nr:uncharacterized protein LOC110266883 [Arachis ipaensis]